MPHAKMTSKEMQQCIDTCIECYRVCLETAHHCLMLGGKHADAQHIGTLLGCASACQACASAMLLGSQASGALCAGCAEVCRACAESCRKMGDDETMKKCAEVCERCAESCEKMAGMA